MFKNDRALAAQWTERMIERDEGRITILPSYDYPRLIMQVDLMMRDVIRTTHKLFIQRPVNGRIIFDLGPIAKQLRQCIKIDVEQIEEHYCKHKLSPYFKLFAERTKGGRAKMISLFDSADRANEWVEAVRTEAKSNKFAKMVSAQERSARKNALSALEYLRGLHERNARLCVVRVDLSYSKEHRNSLEGGDVDALRLKRDLTTFLHDLRRDYPSLVGYVWKVEYGPVKSYHVHFMAIFNGHEIRSDGTVGRVLGEHWRRVITSGDGGYWNCNASKAKAMYERWDSLGIGTVCYHDESKRKSMEDAVLYLAKADYYARLNDPRLLRTFGKGQLKSLADIKLGRPRESRSA